MAKRTALLVAGTLALLTMAPLQPAAAQPASPDARELKAYALTMGVVTKLAKANAAAVAARAKDPRQKQLAQRKGELAALEAKEAPSDADQERMAVLADEIARSEDEDDADGDRPDASTIAEYARRIDATPAHADAVRAAGLTSREYATAMMVLVRSSIAWGLMKEGLLKQAPPEVSPQNLEFVRVHEREIAALGVLAPAVD